MKSFVMLTTLLSVGCPSVTFAASAPATHGSATAAGQQPSVAQQQALAGKPSGGKRTTSSLPGDDDEGC